MQSVKPIFEYIDPNQICLGERLYFNYVMDMIRRFHRKNINKGRESIGSNSRFMVCRWELNVIRSKRKCVKSKGGWS